MKNFNINAVATMLLVIFLGLPVASGFAQQLPPAPQTEAAKAKPHTPAAPDPQAKVWVNTKSGKYFCPGSEWYGNTKTGQYATQDEAQKAGYKPAFNHPCAKI